MELDIIKTQFSQDDRTYKLIEIRIFTDNTNIRPEFPADKTLEDIADLEQGAPATDESFLTPPQYRLEVVYQEQGGGGKILRKMALWDGCPGKTYDDELEKEIVSKAELALLLNAMVLESVLQ